MVLITSAARSARIASPADHGYIGGYLVICNALLDGNPTILPDIFGPAGPADLGFAMEWNTTLASGKSKTFMETMFINTPVTIPLPASLSVLAIGEISTLVRRRRGDA